MRHSPFLFAITLLALTGVNSCATEGDIVYGRVADPLSESGFHDLTLNIEIPTEEAPAAGYAAIVFIHGGGWEGGTLNDHVGAVRAAVDRGFVAVSINYRLTKLDDADGGPRFPWPAQIADAKCAVRWLRANAASYGVNPNSIGAVGFSAGGHLALMLAESAGDARLEGEYCPHQASSAVQAVVSQSGPADLIGLYTRTTDDGRRVTSRLLDLDPTIFPAAPTIPDDYLPVFADASPLAYVGANGPPILQLQGAADTLVPPEGARAFDDALANAGREHQLVEYTGIGHGWPPAVKHETELLYLEFFATHLTAE